MKGNGEKTRRMVTLICELKQPATVFELTAITGMKPDTVSNYIKMFSEAGLVAFHSFDTSGRKGCGPFPSRWVWQ